MRSALDLLYRASGVAAAAFLAAIFLIVLVQVAANLTDELVGWITGEPIGLVVPSYAEFAGFFLAASTFLALAYTLRSGGHIRVLLIIQNLDGRPRRLLELWCLAVAASLVGYFTFYTFFLVAESFTFGDLSYGMVPVPLWLPQTAVAVGLLVLTVALVDEFVAVLRGRRPSYQDAATELPEAGSSAPAPGSGGGATD